MQKIAEKKINLANFDFLKLFFVKFLIMSAIFGSECLVHIQDPQYYTSSEYLYCETVMCDVTQFSPRDSV